MKKILLASLIIFLTFLFSPAEGLSGDNYYARCNLKVVKGSVISWVNWQSTRDIIAVGTKLEVSYNGGKKARITDPKTNREYTIILGASGKEYLEKFVSKRRTSTKGFSSSVKEEIERGLAAMGMTRKQVYIAMGPPASADYIKTNLMTYDDIMNTKLWVYKRKRFGKNIGVEFGKGGKVTRTEGIWR
jgi:hypothetical protein